LQDAIYLQVAIAWDKQAELVLKKFSLINILTWHSHTTSSGWFLFSSRSC